MNKWELADQPDFFIHSESERFFEQAAALAEIAGLTSREAEDLMGLCQSQAAYPTYAELRKEAEELADSGIEVQCIGHSQDHPQDAVEPRPIYATKIGRQNGKSAYLEGVQHGNEPIGACTARMLRDFAIAHSSFFVRMGFDNVITSDHGDPDSMHLQGSDTGPLTLKNLPFQYRGDLLDQHCWSFPTRPVQQLRGNTAATLRILAENDIAFFGALHGAHVGSEVDLSHVAAEEPLFYQQVFYQLGMSIAPLMPVATEKPFARGVNKEMTHNNSISGLKTLGDSTTVCDYLSSGAKYINPDFACFNSLTDPNDPLTDQTFVDVVRERTTLGLTIIGGMTEYLEDPHLQEWLTAHTDHPEADRLHRAAHWWATATPDVFREILRSTENMPEGGKLRQSEVNATWPYPLSNTAIYMGNIASLGARADLPDIRDAALADANRAIDNLSNLQPIPIGHHAAIQAIALVAAMNYARG